MVETKPYMIADFTRALEDDGRELVIDGVIVRGFVTPVEISSGEFQRSTVVHQKIFYLAGELPEKVVGQEIVVDGVRWLVIDISDAGVTVCLFLERGMG